MLYPLKFRPRPKERIWGGRRLSEKLGKRLPRERTIGESWEISGLDGDVSVVGNGILAGNNLEELIEVYMGDLVGDKIYEKFGLQFPLLIKYIDAQDKLSVQVHPDDALAAKRYGGYGKSEMWYVLDCDPGAELYLGFDGDVSRERYAEHVERDSFIVYMLTEGRATLGWEGGSETVKKGETLLVPACIEEVTLTGQGKLLEIYIE